MRINGFLAGFGWRSASTRLVLAVLLAAAGVAGPALAQSFLGTIRGTVVDPQGAAVPGAAVLITDEATGVPRAIDTDVQGRFEAPNLRPGSYRVEIMAQGTFKKFVRSGVVLTAAGTARVDAKLEIGSISEEVLVAVEAPNITVESPAITRGLDEQQLRDLPRNSRDVQDFLVLNPNVVGTGDALQFLGGRTYGVTYIQDGQASTNAIFGSVGNSAPGLDAIAEVQVLSNSYSAEYGGLAGLVVTTKRGGNAYHGNFFGDLNHRSMNALTYSQKYGLSEEELADLRSDPDTDTSHYRWGGSFGGPVGGGKTFFYVNYEGSKQEGPVEGGGLVVVPSMKMRSGDFSEASFTINDPLTGQPFPGNVIPASRLSPEAQNIINFFYPAPNRDPLANGYGRYQAPITPTRNRHRADVRIDHDAGDNSFFLRGSYQYRDPRSISFELNGMTNLGYGDSSLKTGTGVFGWTRVFSPAVVNELRVGYNRDYSFGESQYFVQQMAQELGLEPTPGFGPEVRGFPSFVYSGANVPRSIRDLGRNANRSVTQDSFSVADNMTWIMGSHSLKGGALWNRNMAEDGFGLGTNNHGEYRFSGSAGITGNAFADLLLGLPQRTGGNITSRGPLDGHSDDYAAFIQDDWRVNPNLTVFLGLRYELVGAWHERDDILAHFVELPDGWHHVVPNAQVATLLPPAVQALGRTKIASDVGLPDTLINTDKNNFSPRVGFAWRLGEGNKNVVRGGVGLFHPTTAIQGLRDFMATNAFRHFPSYTGVTLKNGFSIGEEFNDAADYGSEGFDVNLQAPDIYQYNLTFERELTQDLGVRVSYIGSTMRKLLVTNFINQLPPTGEPFDATDPEQQTRLPLYPYINTWTNITTNAGSGQFHAGQIEFTRRWRKGAAFNVAYTLAHSDSNAPDIGYSTLGVSQSDFQNLEYDRGPDPNVVRHRVVGNATVDIPVGHDRKYGSGMPGWANALFGGWTVSTIFQARTGQYLTPVFGYGAYDSSTNPWGTGFLTGAGGFSGTCCWRPNQVKAPQPGGETRDAFFDVSAYEHPGFAARGNVKRGSLKGPGTWVVNLAFYKDVVAKDRFRLQLSVLLDNAFNHPQFFVIGDGGSWQTGFMDLTDYLVNGIAENGITGVLGADTVNNAEGFSAGRVIRFGLRATF
jgi:hypothetical protein